MEWLTRLPVVGPVVAWLLRSRPYRVYEYYNEAGSNRLAGAVTFFGFLAMFPLITVAMAVTADALGDEQVKQLQTKIEEQLPAIASSVDLTSLARNAGTVGVVSGALLLVSGLGWVDTLRASIRLVWRLPAEPGNPIVRKALDVGVLIGLGLVAGVSIVASSVTSTLTAQAARWLGMNNSTPGQTLLGAAGFVIAVGADMILFAYLLFGLPRIADRRRWVVLQGALLGAVGFELLKLLLSTYLSRVAGKTMYGTFGTPIALLLWINFICRWLLYCAAWTATDDPAAAAARGRARAAEAWTEAGGVVGPVTPNPPAGAEPAASGSVALSGAWRGRAAPMLAAFASGAAAGGGLRRLRGVLRGRRR